MTGYDSNFSRREFLKRLGFGSLILGSGTSSVFLSGCSSQTTTIKFTAPSSYNVNEEDWHRMTEKTTLGIQFADNGNDVGPVLAKMTQGTMAYDFDVQGLQGGAEKILADSGLILPWDTSKLKNWSSLWEWAKSIPYTNIEGKQYSIPLALNADSMIYLPDELKNYNGYEDGNVDSYSAVFDSKLEGRTSMEDAWINSVIFTAIYLKESESASINDPGNLSASELKEVMTFLIDKKKAGQFLRFWRGWEQGLQMIKSKSVLVMTGWEPIVKAANAQGVNAKYAVPREGYEGWANTLLLQIGADKRGTIEEAHIFADWLLSGRYGCALLDLRGYVVPANSTIEFARTSKDFDEKTIAAGVENVKHKLSKHTVYWQNVRPDEYKLYDEWWEKLRRA